MYCENCRLTDHAMCCEACYARIPAPRKNQRYCGRAICNVRRRLARNARRRVQYWGTRYGYGWETDEERAQLPGNIAQEERDAQRYR